MRDREIRVQVHSGSRDVRMDRWDHKILMDRWVHTIRQVLIDGYLSQDSNGSIGEWLADVDNYTGIVDWTGQPAATVQVGAQGNDGYFAFEPPAVRVSRGTTITQEWTGEGGAHDVVALDGSFASDLTADGGATFIRTFDTPGTYRYYCTPHRSLGMKGVIVVV